MKPTSVAAVPLCIFCEQQQKHGFKEAQFTKGKFLPYSKVATEIRMSGRYLSHRASKTNKHKRLTTGRSATNGYGG